MATKPNGGGVDLTPIDDILAEQIFDSMPIKVKAALQAVVSNGATPQQVENQVLSLLPTWTGTGQQWRVVCAWLKRTGA